jgi:hypothetical protein
MVFSGAKIDFEGRRSLLIVGETQKIYDCFNRRLFSNRLPQVAVRVDLRQKKSTVRWDSADLVVGLAAAHSEPQEYMADLLHEMVHIACKAEGVIDVRNKYHNQKFRDRALEVGLAVSRTKALGWGTTSIGNDGPQTEDHVTPAVGDLVRLRNAFGAVVVSPACFVELAEASKTTPRQRDGFYTLKYECNCPAPYNSIRSGRRPHGQHPLNVRCLDCQAVFVCVDVDQTFSVNET